MSIENSSGRLPGFVAEHRGGPLGPEQHRELMRWAIACVEHVLPLGSGMLDPRLVTALELARAWSRGDIPTGPAMQASRTAHVAARAITDPVDLALARAIGQAVATAHMADHSLGAAIYALKATRAAGQPIEAERGWQLAHLPAAVDALVRQGLANKSEFFR